VSRPDVDSALREHFFRLLASYGKVGLLLDDARQARNRVARILYGSETLPGWWLGGRSIRCAHSLLGCLREALEQHDGLRGIAVIDRYLPVSCDQDPWRAIPWDGNLIGLTEHEKTYCSGIEETVRFLVGDKKPLRPAFFMELETSYPHGFWDQRRWPGAHPLRWRTRTTDLLYRLRRRIEAAGQQALLEYGPYEAENRQYHRATDSMLSIGNGAQWRARVWPTPSRRILGPSRAAETRKEPLLELARALQRAALDLDQKPVILLTGAGASLRAGAFGRGMPTTAHLLETACRAVAEKNPDDRPKPPPKALPPPAEDLCACSSNRTPGTATGVPGIRWTSDSGTPVQWMVDHVAQGGSVAELDWHLEKLFSGEDNLIGKGGLPEACFYQFCDAFRSELHRWDHGFCYHHWLLAQLPWTCIITTNFDGFHERAAAAAAVTCENRERAAILRLANPLPNELKKSSAKLAKLRRKCGLLKPYGSLLFPAELALAPQLLKKRANLIGRELEALLRPATEAWLVVVGHSMLDPFIQVQLSALDVAREGHGPLQEKLKLLWVDPAALERCGNLDPANFSTDQRIWDRWIQERWDQGRGWTGPFPARADEFAYDLWQIYQEVRPRPRSASRR
jgi:hypothetical protein